MTHATVVGCGMDLAGLAALEMTTDLTDAVTGADVVIEAVPEDLDLKRC